ncbi:MAG: hypothetical protein ACYSSM_00785 [Planctomycetota bacterium]|jgi:hypothetical protein
MPSLKIRFQKFDQYNNSVFIASKCREGEAKAYERLTKYHRKLESKKYETFLPIYSNAAKGFATIRFKKNPKYNRMKANNTYEVHFDIKELAKLTCKTYVNCFLRRLRLVSEAPQIDEGEDVNLSDSE